MNNDDTDFSRVQFKINVSGSWANLVSLTREQLTCLWMGVNAKDREGLIGA